ncbi:unnamed protein product [Staurois parvus]|uniref:Uncharacterized protein n=1 Tax=Staurois parvus TaxID=386267 RepID=A0ABN9F1Y1_9NEOB|nr:unnamed protein product [Staurois parvus]
MLFTLPPFCVLISCCKLPLIAGADLQLMGPLGNRGSWGPCVLAQTQNSL